ncbi:MAG TPA: AMP-binding protein [Leifsonia sp.]|nr:AMP-binding protein [Leifsonia sp.]
MHTLETEVAPRSSYAKGDQLPPLLTDTIGDNFMRAVKRYPDREALVDKPSDRRWTYAELSNEIDAVALGLLAMGVTKGDRVGIWAPNCAEWVFVQYGTARIGAILVNINPAYRPHELSFVVQQSGLRTIVAAPEFKGASYADMIESVRGECPDLVDAVFIGERSWTDLVEGGRQGERKLLDTIGMSLSNEDAINIQYTSGTTGFPKGATLSHRNILNNGFFVGEGIDYTEADRICIPVPFYHCFGMVMGNLGATSHGATMVIPAPAFDPVLTLTAVAEERCTSLYGVPTMFIAELNVPNFDDFDLSSLRTGIMAGSPCPEETMKQVIERMGADQISICYGMTETSPVSAQTSVDDTIERRVSTVGRVHPHLEVQIVDPESGRVLPRGETGEFCTRGYSLMLGYWNQPDKTAETIDADGWMHTGDLGVMDVDGYLNITGRIKDVILRGGENIYPREIEEFLLRHPDILDVQVVGVPDPEYGEQVMAWIRMKTDSTPLDADSIREYSTGRLAHYKIPRYVHLTDEFPMTITGKVRKVEMRRVSIELLDA